MTTPASPDDDLARMPFDELVAELQRVVQSLEAGRAGLEESIELYKLGLRLHAACEERLRAAELTITELGRRGATGGAGAADASAAGAGASGGSVTEPGSGE